MEERNGVFVPPVISLLCRLGSGCVPPLKARPGDQPLLQHRHSLTEGATPPLPFFHAQLANSFPLRI